MSIPSDTQIAIWIDDYFHSPEHRGMRYEAFLVVKASEHALERAAKAVEALRVGGNTEWSESHLSAVQSLSDAAAAIRNLKTEP